MEKDVLDNLQNSRFNFQDIDMNRKYSLTTQHKIRGKQIEHQAKLEEALKKTKAPIQKNHFDKVEKKSNSKPLNSNPEKLINMVSLFTN